jgi:hypothetical protein
MRRIFLLALAAMVASGCGATVQGGARTYRFNMFATVDVVVVNDCVASTIYVKPPQGREVAIVFGNAKTITLQRYLGDDSQLLLIVRGVGNEGAYLGSDSRTFYTGDRGRREESWHVESLRGGTRQCRQ